MPDPSQGFSRPCPSCGRRLPRTVALCRCGAEVAALADEPPAQEPSTASAFSPANLAVGALLLVALAGAGYWSMAQPPAADPIPSPEARLPTASGRPQPAAPAVATAADISPERRAWEAELAKADARPPEAAAPTPSPEAAAPAAANLSLEDVVGRVMPAVVLVETSSGRGSGFFVRPDTIITNVHVVKDDAFVKLRRVDGTTVQARVETRSPAFDIAILKLTSPAAGQVVIPMGSADTLRAGQEVFTIGSALGTLQNSVTRGIVSGVRRSGDATLVQTDAAANPGNSGGPLLDRSGVAIGITTMGYRDQQGLNFAVAIDHARAIIDGRVAASTSKPLAMNELKTLSPAVPSSSERALEEGQRVFLATVTQAARAADALDSDWQRFRQSCYSGAMAAGSYSHEWFIMLTPRAVTPAQSGGGSCATFLVAFQKEALRVGAEMKRALEDARRAGVLPGVVRDALRTHRLEFDGWDR